MFCRSLLTITLVALHTSTAAAAATVAAAAAGPAGCVSFDTSWNLLAFGFNGKDYNVGTQDTWTSPSAVATDITTSNRPPFNSANTTCYLSQFTNAIYVLNADIANPTSIYIYDATAKSWSMQSVTPGTFDSSNFATILDHDTNVFYAYSDGKLFSLDMGLLNAANSTSIPWNTVQEPDLSDGTSASTTPGANTAGYQPTMALAQNHIHFMGVPGLPAGSVKIFVIHFSYMQPTPQPMGSFPTSHGKTASFFVMGDVQHEFAYIPDDGSATYVVNVQRNDTKKLTGPAKDPFATYSASTDALVQLTTTGKVSFLAYNPNTTTSGGTWTTVSALPTATFSTSSTSASATGTATGAKSSSTGSTTGGSNGTSSGIRAVDGGILHLAVSMALAVLLGFVGLVL